MELSTHLSVDLSISIVNSSNWALLKPCLESIYENVKGISFEILVVDNASTDGSAENIKFCFPGVILSENSTKFGFAKNNNINLRKATGRYQMLLNDDTLVQPGSLEKAIQFLDCHPEIGAVGCEMVYPDGTFQVASARKNRTLLSEILIETGLNPRWNYILPTPARGQEFVNIEMCSEAGLIVRREVVNQIGLLDEQFFMYGEGADWCRRIRQAGWKIVFLPGTRIVHYGDQTNKRVKLKMYLQFYKSTYLYFKKDNNLSGNIYRLFILLTFTIKRWFGKLKMFFSSDEAKKRFQEKMPYYDGLLDLFKDRLQHEDYPLPNFEQV